MVVYSVEYIRILPLDEI